MSKKARQEASLNYINLTFAFLGLAVLVVACILPYWVTFPSDFEMNWQARRWGLLKLSGKYTNAMMTGADISWIELRDTACGAAASWGPGGGGMTSTGMASAAGNALVGVQCPTTCKQHLQDRCSAYMRTVGMHFTVFALCICGALASLTGSAMPLIGRDRKRDRVTWLIVDSVGFLMAGGILAGYFFYVPGTLNQLRTTSWYQKESIGWCFWMAAAGAFLLLIPVLIQLKKVMSGGDKKPEKDTNQLLTAGASPEFLMPTAI